MNAAASRVLITLYVREPEWASGYPNSQLQTNKKKMKKKGKSRSQITFKVLLIAYLEPSIKSTSSD